MRPWEFDREVTIEYPASTQDAGYGTPVITWTPVSYEVGSPLVAERFPANVQDSLPSKSQAIMDGVLSIGAQQTRIRIPYRSDISQAMRVTVHGDVDRVMKIVGGPAESAERMAFIEMVCEDFTS